MKLGIEEIIEVWFFPANQEAYATHVVQNFSSVDAAREYIKTEADKFFGDLEMVRVTINRQRVA